MMDNGKIRQPFKLLTNDALNLINNTYFSLIKGVAMKRQTD